MRRGQVAYHAYLAKKKAKSHSTVIQPSQSVTVAPTTTGSSPIRYSKSASRVGVGGSLIIHFLLFLFAIFYVIDRHYAEEAAVSVDIVHQSSRPRVRRRAMPRVPSPGIKQSKVATVPRWQNRATTAAEIPIAIGEQALPAFAPPSLGDRLGETTAGASLDLDRRAISPAHQVATVRSPIAMVSAEPPQLKISVRNDSLSKPLELASIDTVGAMVALSETTRLPRFINKVVPRYPELARRAGKEGVVILEAEIGPDGTSRNIVVIQGMGYGCDEAAITALQSSRFFPAYRGDSTVSVRIQIPYRFRFEEM